MTIPYIKNKEKVSNLKSVTINDVLESCGVRVLVYYEMNQKTRIYLSKIMVIYLIKVAV